MKKQEVKIPSSLILHILSYALNNVKKKIWKYLASRKGFEKKKKRKKYC